MDIRIYDELNWIYEVYIFGSCGCVNNIVKNQITNHRQARVYVWVFASECVFVCARYQCHTHSRVHQICGLYISRSSNNNNNGSTNNHIWSYTIPTATACKIRGISQRRIKFLVVCCSFSFDNSNHVLCAQSACVPVWPVHTNPMKKHQAMTFRFSCFKISSHSQHRSTTDDVNDDDDNDDNNNKTQKLWPSLSLVGTMVLKQMVFIGDESVHFVGYPFGHSLSKQLLPALRMRLCDNMNSCIA